ncbi:MAG: response regulator [Leptospiraceae bacterium]|nr:response regulator [Leptospiraceae bacterium]
MDFKRVEKGKLQITRQELSKGILRLDGFWEFYWKELLSHEDFLNPERLQVKPFYLKVPSNWSNHESGEVRPQGYGTFRLILDLPDIDNETLAFKINPISSAYTLEINGRVYVSNGRVGKSREEMKPSYRSQLISLPSANSYEIIIRVSNYYHGDSGGIWESILFGKEKDIHEKNNKDLSFEWFLVGSLLIMAFYHWSLYLIRRKDRSPLWFGLFCFSLVLRTLCTGNRFLYWQFSEEYFSFVYRLEYLTLYLGTPSFVLYTYYVFEKKFYRSLTYLSLIIGMVFSLYVIFFPTYYFTKTLVYYESYIFLIILFILVFIIQELKSKMEEIYIYTLGGIPLIIAIINDILFSQLMINTGYYSPLGLFLFIFSQAVLQSRKFSRAFYVSEILSLELKEYSKKLEEQNEKLQTLDKIKDEFLAKTSHELRTPLNGIVGIADSMLDKSFQLTERAKENLSLIILSGKRLTNLVNDILDYSKLKNRDIVLQQKEIELYGLVDFVFRLHQQSARIKDIQLMNHVEKVKVYADEGRIQQILMNLIGNAIKFTHEGSVSVQTKQENEKELIIQIMDTGIGIPRDKYEYIFHSFEQVDSSISRKYGGTGLGLSVCKQLVELYGGKIWVESTPGKGSCFSFTLPIRDSGITQAETIDIALFKEIDFIDKKREEVVFPEKLSGKIKVLIVDDEPINLQVLENYLETESFFISRADSGKKALQLLKSEKPDLILLDVMMPELSGYEVCKEIRKKYTPLELPVIMLTARSGDLHVVEGMESGANDYLTKPFLKEELFSRIQLHLRNAKVSRQFSRFVPHEFLRILEIEDFLDIDLNQYIDVEMGVMFIDIVGFTNISEVLSPYEGYKMINNYLKLVCPIIRKQGGIIIKYLGDGIMAIFPKNLDLAIQASIRIHKTLEKANQIFRLDPSIKVKIGLHYGDMTFGIVGESNRLQVDSFSDNVNLAARIEGLAGYYNAATLVTDNVLTQLVQKDRFRYRFLDEVIVKGKTKPEKLYEVLDSFSDEVIQKKLSVVEQMQPALELYRRGEFEEASKFFHVLLKEFPGDFLLKIYLERCITMEDVGALPGWSGIWIMRNK